MAGRYTNTVALCCGVAAAAIAAPAHAGSYKVLYSFQGGADGSGPTPLIQADEKLYGATILGGASNAGTVFSIDLKTGTETVLYSFAGGSDSANPMAGLIAIGDELYGTTSFGGGTGCGGDGCGTVYAINKKTGAEKIVYAFQGGNDGRFPAASLLRKGAALFGATEFGGGSTQCEWGCGTVFSLTLKTGAESVLYAFANPITGDPSGGVTKIGTRLFGVTQGILYSVNPKTGAGKTVYEFGSGLDSGMPSGTLIDIDGLLYGTAQSGGKPTGGTVFAVNPATKTETIVYSFRGGSDGIEPSGGLLDIDGTLYGTTGLGGAYSTGTLFSLDLNTGKETVLHSFGKGSDGKGTASGVINFGGKLYGTAGSGGMTGGACGSLGCGIVFSYKP